MKKGGALEERERLRREQREAENEHASAVERLKKKVRLPAAERNS